MERETFYTYFERAFFSSKSQDIIKSKEDMIASIGNSDFIKNLLTESGKKAMYDFLKDEMEYDEWETLVEFFVENGIIMLDVCGYYKYFGPGSLDELEIVYRELVKDIYKTVGKDVCTVEDIQDVLESQSNRLGNFLMNTSMDKMRNRTV